jgi:hypothetical protein
MIAVRHLRFFADRRRSMGCYCECAHKDVDASGVTAQLARLIRILAVARLVYQVPDFPNKHKLIIRLRRSDACALKLGYYRSLRLLAFDVSRVQGFLFGLR